MNDSTPAVAEVVVDNDVVIVNSRGPSYTTPEDLCLVKAFIRASQDAVVGANQRTNQFKAKFHDEYKRLVRDVNSRCGTSLTDRTANSAFNRFKKMSRLSLKLIGCESSVGDPPSGDTDKEEWEKEVRKLFITRNPEGKNIVENVYTCKHFLEDFPKWRVYEEEDAENANKKRERPEGNKKAKERKADQQFVMNCIASGGSSTVTGDLDEQAQKKQRSAEEKSAFMKTIGSSMSLVAKAFSDSIADSNELKLLPHLSPESKSRMVKQIYDRKMASLSLTPAAGAPATNVYVTTESMASPMTEPNNNEPV